MTSWRELSIDERNDLVARKKNGESPTSLSTEIGINPITLARRLQEWEKEMKGVPEGFDEDFHGDDVTEVTTDANHKQVTLTTDRILTVEDLIVACKVDPEEWDIEKSIINKWEGYRKHEKKSLRWEGGSIQDGFVDDDGTLNIQPLYQVKVWLVRKNPIPINPVIKPVRFSFTPQKRTESRKTPFRTALILPDAHFGFRRDLFRGKLHPFHDRRAVSIALSVANKHEINDVVFLGDMLDLPEWSQKFLRTPDFEQMTQPALVEAGWWFTQFRTALPEADMYYIEGNHEKRLRDAIAASLPQAYMIQPVNKMISYSAWEIPSLLNLQGLGIEWVGDYPNGVVWLSEYLAVIHGEGLSAQRVIDTTDVSTIFGHIHRLEMAVRPIFTKDGTKVITSYCPGFLGLLDGSVPGAKDRQRWSQGFGVVTYTEDGYSNIEHVEVNDGVAVFRGEVYVGENHVEDLRRDTGSNFNF